MIILIESGSYRVVIVIELIVDIVKRRANNIQPSKLVSLVTPD